MHQQNVEFRNPDLPLDSPLIIENDPKNERPEDERPPMKTDFYFFVENDCFHNSSQPESMDLSIIRSLACMHFAEATF